LCSAGFALLLALPSKWKSLSKQVESVFVADAGIRNNCQMRVDCRLEHGRDAEIAREVMAILVLKDSVLRTLAIIGLKSYDDVRLDQLSIITIGGRIGRVKSNLRFLIITRRLLIASQTGRKFIPIRVVRSMQGPPAASR
jgi:hypothetical protein